MEQRKARSLGEYVTVVNEIRLHWQAGAPAGAFLVPWFRGHGNSAYRLTPGLYRGKRGADGTDANLRRMFEDMARPLITTEVGMPTDRLEWYLTMQHYGVPTRLLDWTASSLSALFFAVRDHSHGRSDAVVWMLHPHRMNQSLRGDERLLSKADGQLWSYVPDLYGTRPASGFWEGGLPKPPVAIQIPWTNRRIAAQRGAFTLHGRERKALDDCAELSDCLARVTIPDGAVAELDVELAVAGVRYSTVFPDLDGLAKELAPLADAATEAT